MSAPATQLIALDCHVHLYCFDELASMLHHASSNLAVAAGSLFPGQPWTGLLVLTETAQRNSLTAITSFITAQGADCVPGWRLSTVESGLAVQAEDMAGSRIFLVAGQQIITSEKLEVLALGCQPALTDGLSLPQTLAAVQASQAFPVLPWGVGKWLGDRGRTVEAAITSAVPGEIALADNSGRPFFWLAIGQFASASRKKIPLLRGSDPLPLPGQIRKVGSFGTCLHMEFDPLQPAASLRRFLTSGQAAGHPFGQLESAGAFFRNQLALRRR